MTINSIRPASHVLAPIDLPWPQAFLEFLELRHGVIVAEWQKSARFFIENSCNLVSSGISRSRWGGAVSRTELSPRRPRPASLDRICRIVKSRRRGMAAGGQPVD